MRCEVVRLQKWRKMFEVGGHGAKGSGKEAHSAYYTGKFYM